MDPPKDILRDFARAYLESYLAGPRDTDKILNLISSLLLPGDRTELYLAASRMTLEIAISGKSDLRRKVCDYPKEPRSDWERYAVILAGSVVEKEEIRFASGYRRKQGSPDPDI